jgi:transcription antitermination factor NusG
MCDEETRQSPRWFALAVKPRFDQAVATTLQKRGYDTLVPMYRKRHRNGTWSRDAELPLFPGHVCCRFSWHHRMPVLTTPGVIQVLGTGNDPLALADSEIDSLQTVMRAQVSLQPFPFLQAGQRVRIDHGTLAGVEGILIGFRQTFRLVLSISLLQKSVLLEVGRDLVTASACAGCAFQSAKGD